jgi:broad specificity phosphatase PhoE
MSRIPLVRHAQVSFLAAEDDNLCAKGETQARWLGKYWLRRGVIFQKAYSGPRVRQREMSRLVAEVHRSVGQTFPGIAVMSELNEYPAQAVMRLCFPKLMQVNPEIRKLSKTYESSSVPGERRRTFEKPFLKSNQ